MAYKDLPSKVPEEVFLAERAHLNQVEQLAPFLVAITTFSILVNGTAGAILGLIWVVLRRLYVAQYRGSVGKKFKDRGLVMYTVPCYFILNTMLMGAVVQAVRGMLLA